MDARQILQSYGLKMSTELQKNLKDIKFGNKNSRYFSTFKG